MLKKAVVLFLIVIYQFSTIGVFADIHLCGGSITNVNVWQSDEAYKCACKSIADNDCCHDIQIKAGVDTEGISFIPYTLKSDLCHCVDLFSTEAIDFSHSALVNKTPYLSQTSWRHWQLSQLSVLSVTVLRS